MKQNMLFIMARNRGWGFQEAMLTFDLPLDMFILPCTWFDAGWLKNPSNFGFQQFFSPSASKYHFDNFFPGAFCFHWHNQWNSAVHPSSPCKQLVQMILDQLSKTEDTST
jgi:hypothetical protein